MELSLAQRIIKNKKPFTLYHTYDVTEESVGKAIKTNKSMDLDIALDKKGNPFIGHSLEYYRMSTEERPKCMDFDKAIDLIAKSSITAMVDCKQNNAWSVIEDVVKRIGAHRCLVHSAVNELKFPYRDGYDQDYPSEWSPISKLKDIKAKYPNATVTASGKYLPQDITLSDEDRPTLEKVRSILASNNIDTVCLNTNDRAISNETLDFFLAKNIIPHVNIDNIDINSLTSLYVGETDVMEKASDSSELYDKSF
jgi:hypothetical protein